MNRSLDEIYLSISTMLIRGIDGEFSDAILEVELHSLAMKLSGGYLGVNESEPSSFSFIKEDKKILMNDLIELHIKTVVEDKDRWNTLNYTLHPTGEFKVDFEWDQGLADKVEKVYAEG